MASRIKAMEIEVPARLNITYGQAIDHQRIRRYAHSKGITLPGEIEVEADTLNGGWHITVWEQPNNDL